MPTDPKKSPNWAIKNATAKIGDDATLVFGETTVGVTGFQFGFNVGGWINVCVDPIVCLPRSDVIKAAISSVPLLRHYRTLMGRSQFLLCNNSTIRMGAAWELDFGGKDNWEPQKESKEKLQSFFKMMGAATVFGLSITGAAGKVAEDWDSKPATTDIAPVVFISVASLLMLAIAVAYLSEFEAAVVSTARSAKKVGSFNAAANVSKSLKSGTENTRIIVKEEI